MKKTFRDQGTWTPQDSDYEQIKDTVSMTVPDQNYSIAEILKRFGAGIAPETNEGYYSDTDDYDDDDVFTRPDYDLTDIEEIKARVESALRPKKDENDTNEVKQNDVIESNEVEMPDDLAELKPLKKEKNVN